ncbi:MAG: hypothetical protein ACRDZR_01845 [Acidimicrobiales bacterium]
MRSLEILAGGLAGACLPVPPPGDGVCRMCHGDVDAVVARTGGPGPAGPRCGACRAVAALLGRPPVTVTPVSLTTTGSRLHRVLASYKARHPGAGGDARRLAGLVEAFARLHLACVAPRGVDAVLVVPSLGGRRPPPHPFHGVLGRVAALPALLDCLVPGPGTVDGRRAALDAVACTRSLAGLRVLVADDTYASGAHLQSAAAAATAAGAIVVGGLVVGRFVRARRASGEALLAQARARVWDPASCARCAGPPGHGNRSEEGDRGPARALPRHGSPRRARVVLAPRGMGMGIGGPAPHEPASEPRPPEG